MPASQAWTNVQTSGSNWATVPEGNIPASVILVEDSATALLMEDGPNALLMEQASQPGIWQDISGVSTPWTKV